MSDLQRLRERRNQTQERLLSRTYSIKSAVTEVLNSDAAQLTFAAHASEADSKEAINALAENLVEKITERVANPVNAFLDYMKRKGVESRKIREKVYKISAAFDCAPADAPYETHLEAVAMFMEQNPNLYDDVIKL